MASADKEYAGYPNPPLVEALIDIQFSDLGEDALKSIKAKLPLLKKKGFTDHTEIIFSENEVDIGDQPRITSTKRNIGYCIKNDDEEFILQCRTNGFTLSKLKPYTGWDVLLEKSKEIWGLVFDGLDDIHVNRIAVRYINRINIPFSKDGVKMEDYFETSPRISPKMDQEMGRFFMQVEAPLKGFNDGRVVITQTIASKMDSKDAIPIILDLDIYRKVDVSNDSLWSEIEKFRPTKNDVFEACITDKARELFK